MTNPILSNRIATNSAILWQYDKAANLIHLIEAWNYFATVSCEKFWNYIGNSVFPIDRADTYGLNVWGQMLGIPRPTIKIPVGMDRETDIVSEYDENGYSVRSVADDWKVVTISNTLYRGLLKGRYFLMCHTPTVPNYNRYLSIVFGATETDSDAAEAKYDIFDSEGKVSGTKYSRNRALDYQNMTMGFTFPKNATVEEAYLIFQHYDVVYPFPAGIRYAGEFINDALVIGLNNTQAEGQNYKNFVDGLVLAEDNGLRYDGEGNPYYVSNPNGGIFSTTDRANYKVVPSVVGKAYVYNQSSNAETTISLKFTNKTAVRQAVWIDWGNGNCGYRYIPASGERTEPATYNAKGLYAVLVLFDSSKITMDSKTWDSVKDYDLNAGGAA